MEQLLVDKTCTPCTAHTPPLSPKEIEHLMKQVPQWELCEEGRKIRREWKGMRFLNNVAEIAEAQNHHPDIHLVKYQFVTIELWTHRIGGLSENDFILAAKVDQLPVMLSKSKHPPAPSEMQQ